MPTAMEAKSSAEPAGPVRHALYLNEASRTLTCNAPAAAQKHGSSFSNLVPCVVRWANEAPYGRPANVLWGHDTSRAVSGRGASNPLTFLPGSYALTNPTCSFCAIPLIPGINAQYIPRSRRSRGRARNASQVTLCLSCRKPYRKKKPSTAVKFPAVRKRPPLKQLLSSRTPTSTAQNLPSISSPTSTTPSTSRPEQQPLKSSHTPLAPLQDTKAGLRALLQQKKQTDQAAAKPKSGGLADFLSQL